MRNIIRTAELALSDLPTGRFNWHKFSQFALTFDPINECKKADDMLLPKDAPLPTHSLTALRSYLYNWQRIGNQSELPEDVIKKVQLALSYIHDQLLSKASTGGG